MAMKENRKLRIYVRVSAGEVDLILERMKEAGVYNQSEFIRRMALGGYIIKQDFAAVKDATAALNRIGNNVNQLARAANDYGIDAVKTAAIESVRKELELLWQQLISTV